MRNSYPESGSYCLFMRLPRSLTLRIGRLGSFYFPRGYYVYTGRAKRALPSRIERHMRKGKKKRWHIDYILEKAEVLSVSTFDFTEDGECRMSRYFQDLPGVSVVAGGFGSSDCNCASHLFFCRQMLHTEENTRNIKNRLHSR